MPSGKIPLLSSLESAISAPDTYAHLQSLNIGTFSVTPENGNISKIRKTGGYSQKTTNISYNGAVDIQSIDDGFERLDATIRKDGLGRPIVITVVTSIPNTSYTTHYLFEYNAEGHIVKEVEFFDHPTAFT